jgi:secreted Zn-dependent insulinase-like peptidase
LFRDSITEEVYDAELAGLQYSLEYAGDSITVGSVGYNDKLPRLTEKMLGMMKEFKVDAERFAIMKDQVRTTLCTVRACADTLVARTYMDQLPTRGTVLLDGILRPLRRIGTYVDSSGKVGGTAT